MCAWSCCRFAGESKISPLYRRRRFASVYTAADTELLAALDEAHETLSGAATRKVLYRKCYDFHDSRYARLAHISVAHLYRLRHSRTYRERRVRYEKTRPAQASDGGPIRKAGRATCGWTRCTRGIWTE